MNRSEQTKAPTRILSRVVAREMSLEEMDRVAGGTVVITGTNSVHSAEDIEPDN
jgi:hypothetical protein